MRKFSLIALAATIAVVVINAADWPTQSGSPQREGWAKAEKAFTRENAAKIELLYKYKADNEARGLAALTAPIVDGQLITYLGFKEMLVFGGSQDNVYSIDADLNRRIWKTHFEYKASKPAVAPTAVCPGGLTASLAMPGSSTVIAVRLPPPPAGRGTPPAVPAPVVVPATPPPARGPASLFATGFGRSGVFIAVSSDGYLHPLNTSTGADKIPAFAFLPPNAKTLGLNINNAIVYAATEDNCGGNPNALYALDMSGTSDEPKRSVFLTNGSGPAGSGGTSIGAEGTVYTQIPEGKGDVAGTYSDTVLALSKDLVVKDYFTPKEPRGPGAAPGVTPLAFPWKGRELIVAGSSNGRIYLLDGKSLGGADHHTPLAVTEPLATPDLKYAGNGLSGTFSSWEDLDTNTRWIYAPFQGPSVKGNVAHGGVVALRLEDHDGQPVLTPVWTSRDMISPAAPVTANGLVFVLATGESSREAKENGKPYTVPEREKMAVPAVLYVLDGATGAELYSSGGMASTFAHNGGLALANRRIYFTTHDNTAFALGFLVDQPQLTGR